MMIFGLISLEKFKLHSSSSIIRSAIHEVMARLIFVPKVGKSRDNMWLRGADQLVLWVFHNAKNNSATFYLTCDHFSDMPKPKFTLNLVLTGK